MDVLLKNGFKLNAKYIYDSNIDIQDQIHYTRGGMNTFLMKKFAEYGISTNGDTSMFSDRMNRENKRFVKTYLENLKNYYVTDHKGSLSQDFKKLLDSYLKTKGVQPSEDIYNSFMQKWTDNSGRLIAALSPNGLPVYELNNT
jgi:hypothetical protein